MVTSPLAFSSVPWMTTQGALRLSAVFELIAEIAWIAEIKLGADVGRAQLGDHVLIFGEAVLVEHGDDDGARLRLALELAKMLQRCGKPRHANGKSGSRHRLAAKAGDEPIIAPAGSYGAEAHRPSIVARNREGEINFEDRTGVIFEAADDRFVDFYSIGVSHFVDQFLNLG